MIHFIGAGPGGADLITVRGARLLGEADVIIYAGSLVNPELLQGRKSGCQVWDSASMTLEEVLDVMQKAETRGETTVRLHTGDPSLYGAIREQMDALDRLGISYDVTPGVSSFSGAAAALRAEYTLPEVSQSVIITRMAGRTPVPEGEELRRLASHGCTMVLFLSTGLLEGVERELLAGGYTPDTPAAIVYKATWPEKVFRCTVSTLAETARANGITKTALITVGGFLGSAYERSKLYDPGFYPRLPERNTGMRVALTAFTRRGYLLARDLEQALQEWGEETVLALPARLAGTLAAPGYEGLSDWTGARFRDCGALLFVGACGIAVRAIAPWVRDKFTDPAVVSVDEAGQWTVPLLSGHAGGANTLARWVAKQTGGAAAVSTATDVNGRFAVDQWAIRQGLSLDSRKAAKQVSADLLAGDSVGLKSDFTLHGERPKGLISGPAETGIAITLDPDTAPFQTTLRLFPPVLTLGIGCRRGIPSEAVCRAVERTLSSHHLARKAVFQISTIDLKREEAGLLEFCRGWGVPLVTWTAAELAETAGEFTPSPFVRQITGVDNVCERAAVRAGGRLLVRKESLEGVTVAVACRPWSISFEEREE